MYSISEKATSANYAMHRIWTAHSTYENNDVSCALCGVANQFINWPTFAAEMRRIKEGFYKIAPFSGVPAHDQVSFHIAPRIKCRMEAQRIKEKSLQAKVSS
ncbi:hypothetical protein GQR58_019996 [Nymphon striatum]|nr:hypothetical protein GQR58_019996 [Nymphon striatum]